MSLYDFSAQRLFIDVPLEAEAFVPCSREQGNYLLNVLRLKEGGQVLLFNGQDGEWLSEISSASKRHCQLKVLKQVRVQDVAQDLHYLFAPLKRARLDYMVQKATELGVSQLQPVMTHRTQSGRVKLERVRANAVEAAEQCGILNVPDVVETAKLEKIIDGWSSDRHLIFCDEDAEMRSPIDVLKQVPEGPLAVLVGPEGGFDDREREMLKSKPFVSVVSLGPRIMRADTAAVAILTLVNSVLGDWR